MPASTTALAFGYPWWLSYGHLPIVACAFLVLLLGFWRKWSKWPMLVVGAVALWSSAAFVIARFGIDINGRASLPTQSFFRSGTGCVLDIGAGTGRSSIMVLEARPRATLVALDLFGESFEGHFGPSQSPQQRLLANFQAAGVDQRATIVTADMRKLPFEAGAFDAIVSAYAIDHLNRQGSVQSLAEAARVLKPGGDFLLILVDIKEHWFQFAFGPLLMHMGNRGPEWWTPRVQEAGFQVLEEGTRPGTLYLLARRL
ncbi:MAG: class I SAM-dependent methyltransferase [Bryobacteraceae bacterium]